MNPLVDNVYTSVPEPGKRKLPAQRPGRSKQDYQTPGDFVAAVKARFHIAEFDWDLAADAQNAQAGGFYTVESDALKQPWKLGNGWNWLNPPYGDIEPWVMRAFQQAEAYGAQTMVLVPASTGANWWNAWVHNVAHVLLLNGRLTFVGAEGPYPKDCALLLYTPHAHGGYEVWRWKR